MKGLGVSLLLGLLLLGVLLFASWIRTPHHLAPQWHASLDHTLDQVEGFRAPKTPSR